MSPLTAAVLAARGIQDTEEAREFLRDDFSRLTDPLCLPDAASAVERIRAAAQGGENIRIFGDYDCDGITATAVMLAALRDLGATVDYRLPVRLRDGYDLNTDAVQEAAADQVSLLITVDCGITAGDEVGLARERGIDVVIIDHHQPHGALPAAEAVVNPRREDSEYPFTELSGVGVCYQLARAVTGDELKEELDLVAIGTIADVVPLVGENRILARFGLHRLRRSQRPFLHALAKLAGVELPRACGDDIAYRLAPRMNAPGRLDDASCVVKALSTDSHREAGCVARWCDEINGRRRALTEYALAEARLQVETGSGAGGAGIVVCADDWHAGVVGLVATRLIEEYRRPAVVLTTEADAPHLLKGSGRGIEGFSLLDVLHSCEEHLHGYGGHAAAAGVTVRKEQLEDFRTAFDRATRESLELQQIIPVVQADAEMPLRMIEPESVLEMQEKVGPFGAANPPPRFLSRGVRLRRARPLGDRREHLALELRQRSLRVIGFHLADEWLYADRPGEIDMIYSPEVNWWKGRPRAELVLEALRPAGTGDDALLLQRFRRRYRTLRDLYPDRDTLRQVYRFLRRVNSPDADENGELAATTDGDAPAPGLFDPEGEEAQWIRDKLGLNRGGLQCALDMLAEMNLIAPIDRGQTRLWVLLPDPPSGIDMTDSPTYVRREEELRRVREAAQMKEPDTATIARTLYRFDG